MECQQCSHMPSERLHVEHHGSVFGEVTVHENRCDCSCHDAADAGPALLEAIKEISHWGGIHHYKCEVNRNQPCTCGLQKCFDGVNAAIALAKPKR